jgi:hypothetical protein
MNTPSLDDEAGCGPFGCALLFAACIAAFVASVLFTAGPVR